MVLSDETSLPIDAVHVQGNSLQAVKEMFDTHWINVVRRLQTQYQTCLCLWIRQIDLQGHIHVYYT